MVLPSRIAFQTASASSRCMYGVAASRGGRMITSLLYSGSASVVENFLAMVVLRREALKTVDLRARSASGSSRCGNDSPIRGWESSATADRSSSCGDKHAFRRICLKVEFSTNEANARRTALLFRSRIFAPGLKLRRDDATLMFLGTILTRVERADADEDEARKGGHRSARLTQERHHDDHLKETCLRLTIQRKDRFGRLRRDFFVFLRLAKSFGCLLCSFLCSKLCLFGLLMSAGVEHEIFVLHATLEEIPRLLRRKDEFHMPLEIFFVIELAAPEDILLWLSRLLCW
eukprot:m.370715 g.370715  ORF g.370715 m.370715 type:complete len:289 (+) comp56137_c0_seq4:1092-1958(+)